MKQRILILGLVASVFFSCNEKNVEKEIEELQKANLSFSKLTLNGKNITNEQLLAQIKDAKKKGFKIKKITVNNTDIAEIQGKAPNFNLKIKKTGTFKITLVLEKKGFEDTTLEGEITITSKTAIFQKLTRIQGKATITTPEILAQIQGLSGVDYTLKSITINDSQKAEISGEKPNFTINIKKAGTFTATIILEKNKLLDITLNDCEFEINTPAFTFQKRTRTQGSTTITTPEILAQIQGLSGLNYSISGLGYTIKNITISDSQKAKVNGTKPNFTINIKKTGTFTATILLEKNNFLDIPLNDCEFEINLSQKYINAYNYAKTTLNYNDLKAEVYVYARNGLNYTDAQARNYVTHYLNAKTTLNYKHQKAQYYAHAKMVLNYEDLKAQYYAEGRMRLHTHEKAKTYASSYLYAKTTLNYLGPSARSYAYARAGLGYEDSKARAYSYAIQHLNYKKGSKKLEYYFYARFDLKFKDKKAQAYADARTGRNYTDEKAQAYAYARVDLGYDTHKSGIFLDAYYYAKETLNYDNQKAQLYAGTFVYAKGLIFRRSSRGNSYYRDQDAREFASHYIYARTSLNYNDAKAKTYADKRYRLTWDIYMYFVPIRFNEKYAKAYVRAKYELNYNDTKAGHYAKAINDGKTDAEAQTYANNQ